MQKASSKKATDEVSPQSRVGYRQWFPAANRERWRHGGQLREPCQIAGGQKLFAHSSNYSVTTHRRLERDGTTEAGWFPITSHSVSTKWREYGWGNQSWAQVRPLPSRCEPTIVWKCFCCALYAQAQPEFTPSSCLCSLDQASCWATDGIWLDSNQADVCKEIAL